MSPTAAHAAAMSAMIPSVLRYASDTGARMSETIINQITVIVSNEITS